ncbi:lipoate protein ligase C-terminal domain-containing protein, partial [Klebsiella pneumoniae]
KFYGDFFGSGNVQDIEAALKGVRYDHEAIAKALADIDLNQYFTGIERSAVIDLIAQ